MGFSGLWVVWSLLGAPGEKKRENQMYLQHLQTFAPLGSQDFQQKPIDIALHFFEKDNEIIFKNLSFFGKLLMKFVQNFTKRSEKILRKQRTC